MAVTESISVDKNAVQELDAVRAFAKQMLQNRIFLGHYEERRYVDSLRQYRDVVLVHSAEKQLMKDLSVVRNRLRILEAYYAWIGFTPPGHNDAHKCYSLWVQLSNIPFGQYWFQIRHVRFLEGGEIQLKLRCIRQMDKSDANRIMPRESIEADLASSKSSTSVGAVPAEVAQSEKASSEYELDFEPAEWVKDIRQFLSIAGDTLQRNLTYTNVLFLLKFTGGAAVALVFGIISIIGMIGEYVLRLLRELSIFLYTITPILIHVVDAITKCVGGLYILVAMIWRGTNLPPQKHQRNVQRLTYPVLSTDKRPSRFSPRSSYFEVPQGSMTSM